MVQIEILSDEEEDPPPRPVKPVQKPEPPAPSPLEEVSGSDSGWEEEESINDAMAMLNAQTSSTDDSLRLTAEEVVDLESLRQSLHKVHGHAMDTPPPAAASPRRTLPTQTTTPQQPDSSPKFSSPADISQFLTGKSEATHSSPSSTAAKTKHSLGGKASQEQQHHKSTKPASDSKKQQPTQQQQQQGQEGKTSSVPEDDTSAQETRQQPQQQQQQEEQTNQPKKALTQEEKEKRRDEAIEILRKVQQSTQEQQKKRRKAELEQKREILQNLVLQHRGDRQTQQEKKTGKIDKVDDSDKTRPILPPQQVEQMKKHEEGFQALLKRQLALRAQQEKESNNTHNNNTSSTTALGKQQQSTPEACKQASQPQTQPQQQEPKSRSPTTTTGSNNTSTPTTGSQYKMLANSFSITSRYRRSPIQAPETPLHSNHYIRVIKPVEDTHSSSVAMRIAHGLWADNFSIIDDFLAKDMANKLQKAVKGLYSGGHMRKGQIGQGSTATAKGPNTAMRTDDIVWLEGDEQHCPPVVRQYMLFLDSVVQKLRDIMDGLHYQLGCTGGRSKAMCSAYVDDGAKYVWHYDNPNQNGRKLTFIIYLNNGWKEEHGGLLRMDTAGHVVDIAPLQNRLLAFWSDKRTPHSVVAAHKPRYALTIWYFDDNERKQAQQQTQPQSDSNTDPSTIENSGTIPPPTPVPPAAATPSPLAVTVAKSQQDPSNATTPTSTTPTTTPQPPPFSLVTGNQQTAPSPKATRHVQFGPDQVFKQCDAKKAYDPSTPPTTPVLSPINPMERLQNENALLKEKNQELRAVLAAHEQRIHLLKEEKKEANKEAIKAKGGKKKKK